MLRDAGQTLLAEQRLRIWLVELEGQPVAAQVFVAAGGEVVYWNGGFDEAHADLKPAMLAILAAIEDAFARGEARMDLGGGTQEYKLRFADSHDPLTWGGLIPPGPRYPLVRLLLAPSQTRWAVTRLARRLPPEGQRTLQRLLRR